MTAVLDSPFPPEPESNDVEPSPAEQMMAMIALYPSAETVAAIQDTIADLPGAYPADELHCTVLFLGTPGLWPVPSERFAAEVVASVEDWVNTSQELGNHMTLPITGTVSDAAVFNWDTTVLLVDAKPLAFLYVELTRALARYGIKNASEHGFTPHISVLHSDSRQFVQRLRDLPLSFDRLEVVVGQTHTPLELS